MLAFGAVRCDLFYARDTSVILAEIALCNNRFQAPELCMSSNKFFVGLSEIDTYWGIIHIEEIKSSLSKVKERDRYVNELLCG